MSTLEQTQASDSFRNAIAPEDVERVPYYAHLVKELAASPVAVDLLCEVPVRQRNPILIPACLNYAALGSHSQLGPLFESIHDANPISPNEFASRVVVALESDPEIVRRELHRTTQTNEVGRSAVLRTVLAQLRRFGVTDVNLIDIGASAGLNLYLDHYPVSNVDVDDDLTLVCEVLGGDVDFSDPLPTIHARVGVDLNPLDLAVDDDARWLRACLWPEETHRLARLDAIEQLRPSWPKTQLLRGEVLERLDDAVALCENGHPTVVMHTWTAAYFGEEVQRAFAQRMRALSDSKDVYWAYAEWPRLVTGLNPPNPSNEPPRPGACQLVVATPGEIAAHWGWCHAHGRWLLLSDVSGPKA